MAGEWARNDNASLSILYCKTLSIFLATFKANSYLSSSVSEIKPVTEWISWCLTSPINMETAVRIQKPGSKVNVESWMGHFGRFTGIKIYYYLINIPTHFGELELCLKWHTYWHQKCSGTILGEELIKGLCIPFLQTYSPIFNAVGSKSRRSRTYLQKYGLPSFAINSLKQEIKCWINYIHHHVFIKYCYRY